MAERASEVRALMPCPRCGRSLFPALGASAFAFHCKSGHEFSLDDLLRAQSAAVKDGLDRLLVEWTRQHQVLIRTVEDARTHGHVDVAEIFHRHASSLKSRILKVRDAFAQHDSTQRMKRPEARRSGRRPTPP
jgi:hypothetical protein